MSRVEPGRVPVLYGDFVLSSFAMRLHKNVKKAVSGGDGGHRPPIMNGANKNVLAKTCF